VLRFFLSGGIGSGVVGVLEMGGDGDGDGGGGFWGGCGFGVFGDGLGLG